MQEFRSATTLPVLGLILGLPGLGGCNTYAPVTAAPGSTLAAKPMTVTDEERDCLGRAMYFESNRSDAEGLLAVGTVVMNRLEAAAFPNGGICAVVGQPRQFAPGVLTRKMEGKELEKVAEVADAVLDGQRHPKLGRAMHFHTAGLRFPYTNMHYVAVAGGNAFYEKRKPGAVEPAAPASTALAFAAVPPPVMPEASVVAASPIPPEAAPVPMAPAASAPVHHPAPVRVTRAPAVAKPVATADAAPQKPPRSRLALTPAALAPEPPPPPVLNLPRP